jgi:glycosyltransferase involved in cell wall biosynthesis
LTVFSHRGSAIAKYPFVSIIINTDGRVASLAVCLESLRYLRYPNFEVVVVAGPTQDGTRELCSSWAHNIKFGECGERNVSRSRNIGLRISSGEIVAFLDDDSVPEAEWLDDIIPAFENPEVGAAGGFLYDHTGKSYQWRFGSMDRFGTADCSGDKPTPEYNFPGSYNFPHVMANSAFRRTAIIDVGGFDEEYEYFLDESDIICRLVDHGWLVAQLDRGFVHHKFTASAIRNESRVLTSWYSVVKNKTYFSLQNGADHNSLRKILAKVSGYIDEFRQQVQWGVKEGLLAPSDVARCEKEADQGLRDGLARGLSRRRRLPATESLKGQANDFLPFKALLAAAEGRCYVFLTRTYSPGVGGIARYVQELARALAAKGHQIHVLTAGEGHDRVDFEGGVWVHRIVIRGYNVPTVEGLGRSSIPSHLWDYSRTMLAEAEEIAGRRQIDCVCAPIWDIEGIAFLLDRRFPLVTSLHTPLHFYIDTNPKLRADHEYMANFIEPMLALERRMIEECDGVLANSRAIVEEIERSYGFQIDPARVSLVPHGLEDWSKLPAEEPDPLWKLAGIAPSPSPIRLCFIGRLESRKGIDVVLRIVPEMLARHPDVWLDIVGNDRIASPDGRTWREVFEADCQTAAVRERVFFHGEVDDSRLRGFYRAADIVLAPSRFESFGLVHLEAMMHGKPVLGCRAGGMTEVIDDGISGLLAEPGDADSLFACLERLIENPELRRQLGQAGRAAYLERFTAEQMASGVALALKCAGGKLLLATAREGRFFLPKKETGVSNSSVPICR